MSRFMKFFHFHWWTSYECHGKLGVYRCRNCRCGEEQTFVRRRGWLPSWKLAEVLADWELADWKIAKRLP